MRSRLLILTVLVMLLLGVPVGATSGDLDVGVDTTLSEDHYGRIRVIADDVTLDCAGFRVIGTGDGNGILVDNRTNVTVRNCHVSGFDEGIAVHSSNGVRVENNTVTGNKVYGIYSWGAADLQVVGNTATGNCTKEGLTCAGIGLGGSSGSVVDDNTVTDNVNSLGGQAFGILLIGGSTGITVSNNLVARNSHDGIHVGAGCNGNTIVGNTANGNLRGGIDLHNGASNNVITGNVATGNSWAGFAVLGTIEFGSCNDNSLSGNWADKNDHGLEMFEAFNNTVTDNHFHQNRYWGITDDNSTSNTYASNMCLRNTVWSSEPGGLCDPNTSFSDDDGNTFEVDIEWMKWNGITLGCNPEGTLYCPFDSVTRAQMASFLVRALDLPAVSGNRFLDVSGTHAANINALAEAGVTLGCNSEGTLFCPDDFVTRAQMGSFLARALDLTPIPGDRFADVSGPHEPNINAIAEAGITLGCNPVGTLYCPHDFVTRGQMAAFLHRALG